MLVIDVVSDASVVVKWFHGEGDEEIDDAGALLTAHRDRDIAAHVLDLTLYEVVRDLLPRQARPGRRASA